MEQQARTGLELEFKLVFVDTVEVGVVIAIYSATIWVPLICCKRQLQQDFSKACVGMKLFWLNQYKRWATGHEGSFLTLEISIGKKILAQGPLNNLK